MYPGPPYAPGIPAVLTYINNSYRSGDERTGILKGFPNPRDALALLFADVAMNDKYAQQHKRKRKRDDEDLIFVNEKEAAIYCMRSKLAIGVVECNGQYIVKEIDKDTPFRISDYPDSTHWKYFKAYSRDLHESGKFPYILCPVDLNEVEHIVNMKGGCVRQTYIMPDRAHLKLMHYRCKSDATRVRFPKNEFCRNCSHTKWNAKCTGGMEFFLFEKNLSD